MASLAQKKKAARLGRQKAAQESIGENPPGSKGPPNPSPTIVEQSDVSESPGDSGNQPSTGNLTTLSGPFMDVEGDVTEEVWTLEDHLAAAASELHAHQRGDLPCDENDLALSHVRLAIAWLRRRESLRDQQNVLGTAKKHVSIEDHVEAWREMRKLLSEECIADAAEDSEVSEPAFKPEI